MDHATFVDWFRQASPYINAHRGLTFVICFGGEAVVGEQFPALIHDIALLNSIGCRLVLVHGARPQIDQRLREAGHDSQFVGDLRVTDEPTLALVLEAIGSVRLRVEARLSMGLANSPMHGARIQVTSGNFVTAQPIGVRDGLDYGFSGTVRRVDHRAINTWLDHGAIVLLSSLGYSPTGETFNLRAEEVATATAIALQADKLLMLYEGEDLANSQGGGTLRQLSPGDVTHALQAPGRLSAAAARHLEQALRACNGGVRRSHLLRREIDGALLMELFTRDGIGTMITDDIYEGIRPALIDDIGGLLELLRPLEAAGVLVRRSRERLEVEIGRFVIVERDGTVIGCAALYPFADESFAELACFAVATEYRKNGRARVLLDFAEARARAQGIRHLFVLTTRASHWFQEHGFEPASLADLPVAKQRMYNIQRQSKAFIKSL